MAYQQYYYQPYMNNGASPDMLNQYKVPYQQPMQQPMMQQPMAQQMQQPMQQPMQMQSASNELIWVLGEVEAVSFPVAPGNTVTLWDKNNPTIYIKSVNAQGVPSMRILDFNERSQGAENKPKEHKCACAGRYAPIDEFNALRDKFEALCKDFDEYKKGGAE